MTEEFKRYIEALGDKCRKETFHGEYTMHYRFMAEPKPNEESDSITHMQVKPDPVYLTAIIEVYPEIVNRYKASDYDTIARDMLHETCHLYLEPVARLFMWDVPPSQKDFCRETIERQTQRICNTIFDLLPKDWYTPVALGLSKETPDAPNVVSIS